MFKNFRFVSIIALFTLSLILVACGGGDDAEPTEQENTNDTEEATGLELGETKLTLPYVAWARETISTYMLAALLEDVGYDVTVTQVEAGPMFASVADGSADFHTSAWLPATHASYWEDYE